MLNLIFGTEFQVMDKSKGHSQTTKGIWCSTSRKGDVLILDIEGTDSKERGDSRITFEQTTSLFALAMADILMINMKMSDVGKYEAANYGLLKVIFEVNLRLFEQKQNKKIMIVLRDCDPRMQFIKIRIRLLEDLGKIWADIQKPDKYANTKITDYFQVLFEFMPHKNFQEKEFSEKAAEMAEAFAIDN